MALQQFLTSGQPDGTTADNTNTGGTLTKTGGSITWKNDAATGRTKIVLIGTTGTAINARFALSDTTQHKIQRTVKLTSPATTPGAQVRWAAFRHASGTKASLSWETDGRVQFLASDSLNPVVIPAGTLALNTEYVFAFTLDDTAGTATLRIFAVGGSTPIWSKTDISGQNYVSASPFAALDIGGGTTNTTIAGMDDQVNTGTGSEIPDYVASTPLTTPTVTAGTIINPTVVAGSNGTAVGTWPAVANATRYDAYKLLNPSGSPVDADFGSAVATGVTSPYTWTGLSAGNYAIGIKAKA